MASELPLGIKVVSLPPERIKEIRTRYAHLGGAMRNLRPAMEIIGQEMSDIGRETFESQGRRGGGSWQALSAKRVHEKEREKIDPRILYGETHRLFLSVADTSNPENILQVTGKLNEWKVILGTKVPYAKVHWRGSAKRNIPVRKFYKSVPGDMLRFERILRQYFWDAYAEETMGIGPIPIRAPRGHFSE